MTKFFQTIILFLFLSVTTYAQYVTIPDVNFRSFLQQNWLFSSCFNSSGQMDTTCATVRSATTLNCSSRNINDLTGLQYFTSLTELDCYQNRLTSLPPLQSGLRTLDCSYNQLTNLPTLPIGLTGLDCYNNQLTSLPTLPTNLAEISCSSNQLTSLPTLPNGLRDLTCNDNQLISLPTLPIGLRDLICNDNQLTSLPTLPNGLIGLYCYDNQLTSLPVLPSSLISLQCNTNQLTSLPTLPSGLAGLHCYNNPNLTCIPFLPNSLYSLNITNTAISCIPNYTAHITQVSTGLPLCANPSQICVGSTYASGLVYYDVNNNGIRDANESNIPNFSISSSPGGYGSVSLPYGYAVQVDSHTTNILTLTPPNPTAWTVTPTSHTVVAGGLGQVPGSFDFGVRSNFVTDLEAVLSAGFARPGFTQNVCLSINNIGSTEPNTAITLSIPNGWQPISSSPAYTSFSNGVVTWSNVQFSLFESERFCVVVQIPATTPLGTPFTYTASTSASFSDGTPQNNSYSESGVVRGSYDPNDKQVNPTVLQPGYDASRDFVYTVRFQNTGTDTAFTVIIRDTLATQYLDVSTFRIVNASHEYQAHLRGQGEVEVIFPQILLVDSFTNEPLSHGFVQFAIKPKPNLPLNTRIPNTAAIYFDFNLPIITNTATTDILLTSVVSADGITFTIAPNPTDGLVRITADGFEQAQLFDLSGRLLRQIGQSGIMDLGGLSNGMYIVKVFTDKGVATGKILKQ